MVNNLRLLGIFHQRPRSRSTHDDHDGDDDHGRIHSYSCRSAYDIDLILVRLALLPTTTTLTDSSIFNVVTNPLTPANYDSRSINCWVPPSPASSRLVIIDHIHIDGILISNYKTFVTSTKHHPFPNYKVLRLASTHTHKLLLLPNITNKPWH